MSSYRSLTNYVPVAPAPAPAPFELAELLRLIEARRVLILRVAAGTVLAAILVVMLLPTKYSSSAQVMLDGRKNNITDLSAVLAQLPSDPASIQNQIQILTSRGLAAKVVDQLRLEDDPEFNAAAAGPGFFAALNPAHWGGDAAMPDPARIRDAVISAFQKHVTAEAIGLSTTFTVTAWSRDAVKAARLANALAQAYVDDQIATKRDATNNTTDWLGTRIHDLAQQLQVQDQAVELYKAQHGLTDTGPGNSLVDQQMAGISAEIVQARSDLAEKQAQYDRITALEQAGNNADIANVVASPLIIQLRTQQADLVRQEADLSTKYGPLHPKMQALESQKREEDNKIAQEVTRIAGSMASDVMVAKAHLASLEGSLGGTEHEANGQNMARVQLQALESNAASTRAMYEAFVQRLRQAQNQDQVQTAESRIISDAPVPLAPAGPRRALVVMASIPLGLLLGLIAALAAEKFGLALPPVVSGTPRAAILTPKAARRGPRPSKRPPPPAPPKAVWTGPPILAQITGAASLRAADYVIDWPQSRFARGMDGLVHQLDSRGSEAAIVAVTAASSGESKSAIAVSLARAAARMGKKVVLIDCDPTRQATKAMGAKTKSGLYDVLSGILPLNQALVKDPRGGAFLLGMPRRPGNAAAMFGSRAMAKLVTVLRGGAEMVILDCGLAAANPEAALIARLADATVLVARQNTLHAPGLADAARVLEGAEAAPIGIVVVN